MVVFRPSEAFKPSGKRCHRQEMTAPVSANKQQLSTMRARQRDPNGLFLGNYCCKTMYLRTQRWYRRLYNHCSSLLVMMCTCMSRAKDTAYLGCCCRDTLERKRPKDTRIRKFLELTKGELDRLRMGAKSIKARTRMFQFTLCFRAPSDKDQ